MANFWETDPVVSGGNAPSANFWENDPVAEQPPGRQEAWNPALGLSRDLVNGIPVLGPLYTNAVDQVTSNISGMITGEDPQAIRDRVQGKQDAYEAEYPILSTAGQLVGGTVAMAPLAATSAGAKAFGLTGPLWQRLVPGAISGGTVAGADTLARGGSLPEAGVSALVGTVAGAGGAAVAPYIGAGANAVGNAARKALGMAPAAGEVGLSKAASDVLMRSMIADGTLGNRGVINMAQAGPRGMLVDASPNAQALLDVAIARSGGGSKAATDAIEARAAGASDDITQALDAALGQPRGVYAAQNAIRQGTAAPRQAAYDAAYAEAIDYASDAGRQIEQLVTRVPPSIIEAANKMMLMEGAESAQIMAKVGENGLVTYMRTPDTRQLDYITRALNTAARSGEGQGALGAQTDIGRIYGSLAGQIRNSTKQANPAYATALETAATPIQEREALLFGNTILNPSMARDQAADFLEGLTTPQRSAAKQGLRSYVDEVLANVRAIASDPNLDAREATKALQNLSSRAARTKIGMLMADDAATDRLFQQLDEAARSIQLRANVATNSRTFARTAVDEAVGAATTDGPMGAIRQGKPLQATQRIFQALTGATPNDRLRASDKVYQEIVDALISSPDRGLDIISGLGVRKAMAGKPGAAALLPGANSAIVDALMTQGPLKIVVKADQSNVRP